MSKYITFLSAKTTAFVRQNVRDSEGQSLVMIALMFVAILGMAGLIFDGGNAYATRRSMQNSADAAALAAARVFVLRQNNSAATEQAILDALTTYASENGSPTTVTGYFVDESNSQVGQEIGANGGVPGGAVTERLHGFAYPSTSLNNATGIRVVTKKDFPTFFLKVLNVALGSASAMATVQTGVAAVPSTGWMPFAVPQCYVDKYSQNAAKCGSTSEYTNSHVIAGAINYKPTGQPSTSTFNGGINLCNNSNTDAVNWINEGGYDGQCGSIAYGDSPYGLKNSASGLASALSSYLGAHPELNNNILVCVYATGSVAKSGTNYKVPCIGFAGMKVNSISGSSVTATYNGRYVIKGPIDEMGDAFSGQRVFAINFSQ